jgi:NDP-sugar pyrophosphorylase family protein
VGDYVGTAGVLLSLKPELNGDVIVMGADVIVEGDFLHHMADIHRARDAAGTKNLELQTTQP